ncbi:MAG: hypothetical protein FJ096_00965 [Deltaproteobacteria bacterium]|nr:hypothetical protein [Deltaproteobacteria bacterium]
MNTIVATVRPRKRASVLGLLGLLSLGAAPPPSSQPAEGPPPLPIKQLLDVRVSFLARGEKGRLAVLADDDGVVVPYRLEGGAWQKLPLPPPFDLATASSAVGMYFGRDDRPRLMGYRVTEQGARILYLRHRDGAWNDQRREVSALGREDAALFGELGEADPEIVCRAGGECLLKSRKGWTLYRTTPPKEAVTRGFFGRAYALTSDGLYRGEATAFVRLGDTGPWRTRTTGFWVGPTGEAVVVEPAADALHVLDPASGRWTTRTSPVPGPRDVAGPAEDRLIVGDGGLVRVSGAGATRLGAPSLRLDRVIMLEDHAVAAGPSGVFLIGGK